MTTSTTSIEEAQRLPCETCGGSKKDPSYRSCSILHDGGYIKPCPSCQDETGVSTGLAFWWLTKQCPRCQGTGCRRLIVGHNHQNDPEDSCRYRCGCCCGTGRVPLSKAERVSVLFVEACKVLDWDEWEKVANQVNQGTTPDEALAAGVLSAQKGEQQ